MKFSRVNKDEFGFDIDELDEENIDDNSYKLIKFGLSDVELKLKSMSSSIQSSILKDYSELSAKMLDLILGMSSSNFQKKPPADLDKINLLLSRLGKESINQDTLSKSIVESKDSEESKLLSFFLNELLNSQNKHSAQEASIENFIKIINSYLTISSEEKFLKFDKAKFSVSIYNSIVNENLNWNSLSSGEKQVVSIFSKLLLEEQKDNLIIIDEPELSLSIEWQRKFLPDIVKADSCKQLIAITHSPFIFDNDLDQFAKSIKVDIEK